LGFILVAAKVGGEDLDSVRLLLLKYIKAEHSQIANSSRVTIGCDQLGCQTHHHLGQVQYLPCQTFSVKLPDDSFQS